LILDRQSKKQKAAGAASPHFRNPAIVDAGPYLCRAFIQQEEQRQRRDRPSKKPAVQTPTNDKQYSTAGIHEPTELTQTEKWGMIERRSAAKNSNPNAVSDGGCIGHGCA